MRYLGHLRQQMQSEWWKKLLMSLAIASSYKAVIRSTLRETLRKYRMSDYSCKSLVAATINNLFNRLHNLGLHRAGKLLFLSLCCLFLFSFLISYQKLVNFWFIYIFIYMYLLFFSHFFVFVFLSFLFFFVFLISCFILNTTLLNRDCACARH